MHKNHPFCVVRTRNGAIESLCEQRQTFTGMHVQICMHMQALTSLQICAIDCEFTDNSIHIKPKKGYLEVSQQYIVIIRQFLFSVQTSKSSDIYEYQKYFRKSFASIKSITEIFLILIIDQEIDSSSVSCVFYFKRNNI